MENYEKMIKQLENGEINRIIIQKEQFYLFREIIVKHPKFKHFRGEAKQGGTIIYTFLNDPRS